MARLLVDSLADSQARLEALIVRQKLREQLMRDGLLDRVGSLICDGWFSRAAARGLAALAQARSGPHRRRIAAENQARLIRLYHSSKSLIEVHDAAETAEDHGLQPKDLANKTSGKRKRRRRSVPRAIRWPYGSE